jgi:flagellar export protein FliJ
VSRRFRLAPLERLRDARLEEATRALAQARRAFADAGAARDAVAARLAAATPRGGWPGAAALAGYHRAYLRDRLAEAEAAVTAAAAGVDEALAAWHAARTDVRAVRTLHERYEATLAAADARREQVVLDDLAAGLSFRTRREHASAGAP